MNFFHIVAVSKNFCIGKDGQLPWRLPEDLKLFKKLTMNHIIVMGRKTYDSIGKPLPGRLNVVISKTMPPTDNVLIVKDLADLKSCLEKTDPKWPRDIFIIGGATIYEQTVDLISRIYLTRVDTHVDGDAFYSENILKKFTKKSEESFLKSTPQFVFEIYDR